MLLRTIDKSIQWYASVTTLLQTRRRTRQAGLRAACRNGQMKLRHGAIHDGSTASMDGNDGGNHCSTTRVQSKDSLSLGFSNHFTNQPSLPVCCRLGRQSPLERTRQGPGSPTDNSQFN